MALYLLFSYIRLKLDFYSHFFLRLYKPKVHLLSLYPNRYGRLVVDISDSMDLQTNIMVLKRIFFLFLNFPKNFTNKEIFNIEFLHLNYTESLQSVYNKFS